MVDSSLETYTRDTFKCVFLQITILHTQLSYGTYARMDSGYAVQLHNIWYNTKYCTTFISFTITT